MRIVSVLSRNGRSFKTFFGGRPWLMLLLALSVSFGVGIIPARAGLAEYVKQKDDSFSWKLKGKLEHPLGTVYDVQLVSQTWQGIRWEHALQVYVPKGVSHVSTMLLWNQGGKPSPGSIVMGMTIAARSRSPVAFLYGIPSQPLYNGKVEDRLIAETFVRYLETKDESWPLLFPMVKSLVKAMDALQALGKEQKWEKTPEHFIVTGASKRGWTTWLTAAADTRVKAIAPMVIDTLNMPKQMEHQKASYGAYSEQINDYTERGLVPMPDTVEAKKLWSMVDPWSYRKLLTMPKLIINGNNDRYWTVDALNLYWDDLPGEKWILYVPNAGHNLQQKTADGQKSTERAINGLAAFTRHMVIDNPMPKLDWKHDNADGKLRLTVNSTQAPKIARLWVAASDSKDFRNSTWKEQSVSIEGNTIRGLVAPPESGYVAFYGELEFEIAGVTHQLATQIRVVKAGEKE